MHEAESAGRRAEFLCAHPLHRSERDREGERGRERKREGERERKKERVRMRERG